MSTTPARLSGRRGLAGLTGSFLDGGGGTAGLSKIPAWLFGRDGSMGLNGLLISVGEDTRFKESFLSLWGHSRVLSFGGGYFALVSRFSSTCLLGVFGVGLRAIRSCLAQQTNRSGGQVDTNIDYSTCISGAMKYNGAFMISISALPVLEELNL